jgi:hypothetical protein
LRRMRFLACGVLAILFLGSRQILGRNLSDMTDLSHEGAPLTCDRSGRQRAGIG